MRNLMGHTTRDGLSTTLGTGTALGRGAISVRRFGGVFRWWLDGSGWIVTGAFWGENF